MIYIIIRVLLLSIGALGCILISRNTKLGVKIKRVTSFLLLMVIVAIALIPVENSFITFKTQESAFHYKAVGKIISIAEGEETSVVLYREDSNTTSYVVCKNVETGYKLTSAEMEREKVRNYAPSETERITVKIFKIEGTNDYYLRIVGIWDNEYEFRDSLGTKIEFTADEKTNFIAPIEYTEDYQIFINDNPLF